MTSNGSLIWLQSSVMVLGVSIGCGEPDCPEGTKLNDSGSRCIVVDAGVDASVDGGAGEADAGSDAGAVDSGFADAGDSPDASMDAGTPCERDSDCTRPEASRCDPVTDRCAGCELPGDCGHLSATPTCDASRGLCVACTPETEETYCGTTACDPVTFTCTESDRESIDFCQACRSDSECAEYDTSDPVPSRCVELEFMGTPYGFYCVPEASTECPAGLPLSREVTSRNGETAAHCIPDSSVSTCPATYDAFLMRDCAGIDPVSECGDPGLDDGLCVDGTCTHRCNMAFDCPYESCSPSGSPRYCCVGTDTPAGCEAPPV